jgi:ferredoxin
MNSEWSEFLVRRRYPELHAKWRAILLHYAKECQLEDPCAYVERGGWKGRIGGRKASFATGSQVDRRPCVDTTLSCGYVLIGSWKEHFFELLKPLGTVQTMRDDGVTVTAVLRDATTGAAAAVLRISRPRAHIGVAYVSPQAQRQLSPLLESQIRKLQSCISCGGCASLCPQGAIAVERRTHRIDESRCTHCLACIRRLRYGCLAADSLHV